MSLPALKACGPSVDARMSIHIGRRPMLDTIVRTTLIGLLSLCSAGAISAEQIYRWVDATGDTHFVPDLDEVPDPYREAAIAASKQTKPMEGTVNIIPGLDELSPAARAVPEQNGSSARSAEPAPRSGSASAGSGEAEIVEGGVSDGDDGYYGEDRRELDREHEQGHPHGHR
jgi:hypothetical protein